MKPNLAIKAKLQTDLARCRLPGNSSCRSMCEISNKRQSVENLSTLGAVMDVNIFPHINSARMEHSEKQQSPRRGVGYKTDMFFFSHLKDQLEATPA